MRSGMHTANSQHGFTLVELLTVITLMAIVLGIGIPSFRSFILGQRVKTAAFAFVSSATEARSEAIKRNADVSLLAASGGWSKGWTIVSGSTVLSHQDAYDGVVFTPSASMTTQLVYQSSGRLPSGLTPPIQVQIGDENSSNHTRCISFDLSGLPSSHMGTCP